MPHPLVKKELVFTVTPGRSGTKYLSKLLETVPALSAHHEPDPSFSQVMRLIQSEPLTAYNYLTHYKFPAINDSPGRIYAETSHMTCKGFLEPMIRMGLRPSLIILRRPPSEVAWSLLERNCIPCRTAAGVQTLLDPRDLGVVPLLNWDMASNYQLCFWYALEMERRQQVYTEMALKLGLKVVDVTNRELNIWPAYARLLSLLDLTAAADAQSSHARISAETHNPNSHTLKQDKPGDLKEEEETVWISVGHFQPLLRDTINARYGLK